MEWRLYSIAIRYSNLLKQVTPFFEIRRKAAINLSYKIIGAGTAEPEKPPILILHALLGSRKRWKSLGKTILNITKRSVITVDLRNHGNSPHVHSHTYDELSSDVLRLYERMGIERASLLAHGMGGRTAMYLSLKNPNKVAGLLIIDTSPVSIPQSYKEGFPNVMKAMKTVDFTTATSVYKAVKIAKRQLRKVITEDLLMNIVLGNVRMKQDGTIGWACNLDILMKYFKHIVSFPKNMRTEKFYGPTLFVGGQLSEFLPPDDLNKIREMFPRSVIAYVPKTGHYVHIDNPKTVMEITIAFLRTNVL